ncbi:MAG: GNAT family N-acetyltransferase [Gemmataceae bacterium]
MTGFDWQPPTLTTSRLVLRGFHGSDASALFRVASNPNVTRYTLWNAHRNIDDSHNYISSYARSQYMQQVPEPLAICPLGDITQIMGSVGCFWVAREHQSMELGYWIGEPWWGQGLATEAARALVTHVFEDYVVERMQAHCVVANDASSRVIEKLGFQFEGVARSAVCLRGTFYDVKRYAILRKEWRR